jgi:hypothetical protein
VARWLAGTPTFGEPVELTGLSTDGSERDPWISTDGLLLYFARTATDMGATGDIYRATRTDTQHAFGNQSQVFNLNTNVDDGRVSLTRDERTLAMASSRNGDHSVSDVFLGTRNSATDPLITPIDQATTAGVTLYAPVPKPRSKASEPPDPPPIIHHVHPGSTRSPGDIGSVISGPALMGIGGIGAALARTGPAALSHPGSIEAGHSVAAV